MMGHMIQRKIIILGSVGEGSTALSAFDDALHKIGISNFNLIELSSIIPRNTTIEIQEKYEIPYDIGQMQPVVLSHTESGYKGLEISAGLGWAVSNEGGVFIEISGRFNKEECFRRIKYSLDEMVKRRNWNWEHKRQNLIVNTIVHDLFSSVVVCAIYPFFKI